MYFRKTFIQKSLNNNKLLLNDKSLLNNKKETNELIKYGNDEKTHPYLFLDFDGVIGGQDMEKFWVQNL